jgi:hypothetical protein
MIFVMIMKYPSSRLAHDERRLRLSAFSRLLAQYSVSGTLELGILTPERVDRSDHF